MTTKTASSGWIAIFSGIVLLVLCFLAAETWHSRQLDTTVEVEADKSEANEVGHYPSQSNVSVEQASCENPDDWKIDGLAALAVPENWVVVAPAATDRIEIRSPVRSTRLAESCGTRQLCWRSQTPQPIATNGWFPVTRHR